MSQPGPVALQRRPRGYVALVLHAHLPYVRHPEDSTRLEERWLFEAITECYLPLLEVLERLEADRVPFRITLSLSPTLISMLADPLLQRRSAAHLEKTIELADREVARTGGHGELHAVTQMYQHLLRRRHRALTEQYRGDLLSAFDRFWRAGYLELITSAATHGLLPLLAAAPGSAGPAAVRAQIATGIACFEGFFGRRPRGFWLPECAYCPGLDRVLAEHGIQYFFIETHGLLHARPAPTVGLYAPLACPSGVAAFGRDPESSKQVWSSYEGYPGDFAYREYYRDVGHDLDLDYVAPFIHPAGIRVQTGLKYHRITGPTEHKAIYDPAAAGATAARHAGHFVWCRQRQADWLAGVMSVPPLIVAPYDAELFGHWWFEGPTWLEMVARKAAALSGDDAVCFITPGDYLNRHPCPQTGQPYHSSWGYAGYFDHWLDGSNQWLLRHLHHAAARMQELCRLYPPDRVHGGAAAALQQAARELLLAQASDWPFIMRAGTTVSYARERFCLHLGRFTELYEQLRRTQVDSRRVAAITAADPIFSHPALEPFTTSPH